MATYTIGDMIRGLRIRAGLTQQQLAYPILERAHLSKIERGLTTPSKETLVMIFERLGYNPTFIADFLIDSESERYEKVKKRVDELNDKLMFNSRSPLLEGDELKQRLIKYGINELLDLISQLENDEKFMQSPLNQQWLHHRKANVSILKKESGEEIRKHLMLAIKATMPNFTIENIDTYFLSKQDIYSLTAFAGSYFEDGEIDKAVDISYKIKANYENRHLDDSMKGNDYALVVKNLAVFLWNTKRHEEIVNVCNDAIDGCIKTNSHMHLPVLVYMKASHSYAINGDKEAYEKQLRQVYYAAEMLVQASVRDITAKEAKDALGIELI